MMARMPRGTIFILVCWCSLLGGGGRGATRRPSVFDSERQTALVFIVVRWLAVVHCCYIPARAIHLDHGRRDRREINIVGSRSLANGWRSRSFLAGRTFHLTLFPSTSYRATFIRPKRGASLFKNRKASPASAGLGYFHEGPPGQNLAFAQAPLLTFAIAPPLLSLSQTAALTGTSSRMFTSKGSPNSSPIFCCRCWKWGVVT